MPTADLIERLQRTQINWNLSDESPYIFETVFENRLVCLRLNDFPAEPLCTVIVDGTETDLVDLVNWPSSWTLPPPDKRRAWRELLFHWGVGKARADETYDDMCSSYAGPGRIYHTLDHACYVVQQVCSIGWRAKQVHTVKLAAWLHDVIYDSRASDNEERSAEYAKELCKQLSIPQGDLVGWLIMQTKTHDYRVSDNERRSKEYAQQLLKDFPLPEGSPLVAMTLEGRYFDPNEDDDAQVLLDADLAILGETDELYRSYAQQIRQEYAWVREPEYGSGRRRVLERFLARPRIYHLLTCLEERARRNMAAEIARLDAGRNDQEEDVATSP